MRERERERERKYNTKIIYILRGTYSTSIYM